MKELPLTRERLPSIIPGMQGDFETLIERIQNHATQDGLGDLRLAREEFHQLTGEFEESEPWFELRMTMFLDWYLLDRKGDSGLTPAESYLVEFGPSLSPEERRRFEHLTVSMRSVFKISKISGRRIHLSDLARGGSWLVHWTLPTVGLLAGDIINSRITLLHERPSMGRGTILHPREALETVERIVARAADEDMPPAQVVNHLDKMRLKLDRYSNVKIRHVYQYPDDAHL